jgi:hypothetical protein
VLQIELERLNTATDDINKLEVDLDVSRFRIKPFYNNIKLLMFKKNHLNIEFLLRGFSFSQQ